MAGGDEKRRLYSELAFGAWVGIIADLAMGGAKIAGGAVGASEALVADGIDSLSDTLSGLVVLHGARRARRPPDARHPYGHGKAEVLAGQIVAIMVMIVGVVFGYRAVSHVISPHREPLPEAWTIWFAVGSIVGKESLYRYKMRLGRRLKSESLIADAMNRRSDVLASLVALAGIGVARYLGPEWQMFDPIAAAVICVIIFGIGLAAFVRTASALMDETADGDTLRQIRLAAAGIEGVRDTEKLMTRRSGLETHMELHVEVDGGMSVNDSHHIASQVADAIKRQVPGVTQVTVHIEPYHPDDH